mmetsp:Transcript_21893/g.33413  ORF Transcript_21893/g.33413 Transcript_21893/m.33413 type:complete len:218 (-) Transcript_21893:634-1287(-)
MRASLSSSFFFSMSAKGLAETFLALTSAALCFASSEPSPVPPASLENFRRLSSSRCFSISLNGLEPERFALIASISDSRFSFKASTSEISSVRTAFSLNSAILASFSACASASAFRLAIASSRSFFLCSANSCFFNNWRASSAGSTTFGSAAFFIRSSFLLLSSCCCLSISANGLAPFPFKDSFIAAISSSRCFASSVNSTSPEPPCSANILISYFR